MKRNRNGMASRKLGFENVEQRDPPTALFPIDIGGAGAWVSEDTSSYGDDDSMPGGGGDDTVGGGSGDTVVGGGGG